MAMHESQSLLLEMQVCRGREFLEFARPLITEAFPEAFAANPSAFTTDNLYRLYTRVKPDFMRVDAVGTDFRMYPIPNCGKGQPMQTKRMSNGGPTLRSVGRLTGGA